MHLEYIRIAEGGEYQFCHISGDLSVLKDSCSDHPVTCLWLKIADSYVLVGTGTDFDLSGAHERSGYMFLQKDSCIGEHVLSYDIAPVIILVSVMIESDIGFLLKSLIKSESDFGVIGHRIRT